jgi:hypothetical protein
MSTLHLKLDDLIRVNDDARNKPMHLGDPTEEERERLNVTFSRLAASRTPVADADVRIEDLNQTQQDIDARKRKITPGSKHGRNPR